MVKSTTKTSEYSHRVAGFLEKIVIDVGVGRLSSQPSFEDKNLPQLERDVALLSGQKPQRRSAKKSISGFKVREGQTVGLKVTLRRKKMVDFFERLIRIVLPRVRDFNGIDPHSIDSKGTLNLGLKEQMVFSEISPEKSPVSFPLGIAIVPRRKAREAAIEKLRELGVPLKKMKM